jgi:hypothetical protein
LVFFDLLSLADQNAHDGAGLYTFSELWKFDVHGKKRGSLFGGSEIKWK